MIIVFLKYKEIKTDKYSTETQNKACILNMKDMR